MESVQTTPSIRLAEPDISDAEVELVASVMRSGVLALGPLAEEFEARLADLSGRAFAIACSSGTAALHMAVRALGLQEGMEVITSPFSFVASSNCILYQGAVPRFVDIEEETLGLNPDLIEEAATDRTAGIVAVHVFGQPCQIERIGRISDARGWWLVEDACEALGSSMNGRPLGSYGAASTFAFYPNKQITTGEGGVVITDDEGLAKSVRSMRNQGRDEDGTWLRHVQLGYNYRLDEMSAALGVAQLRRIAELDSRRRHVVEMYGQALSSLEWLTVPKPVAGASVNWFVYVVRVDPARIDRDRLLENLRRHGVPARPYFGPLHLQPFYRQTFGYRPGDFPVTERVASSTLALPFSTRLTDEQIAYVAETLGSCAASSAPDRS
jgi:perosamine synthetase